MRSPVCQRKNPIKVCRDRLDNRPFFGCMELRLGIVLTPLFGRAMNHLPPDSPAHSLYLIGFGPVRSEIMARKFPALKELVLAFREAANGAGFRFRVFQSSGRNGYYTKLRLKVITSEKPDGYADTRHYEGPMEEVEVGALGMTHAQARAIERAISDLHADLDRVVALSQAAKLNASLAPAADPQWAASNRRRL